jgi:hypothetical protein
MIIQYVLLWKRIYTHRVGYRFQFLEFDDELPDVSFIIALESWGFKNQGNFSVF